MAHNALTPISMTDLSALWEPIRIGALTTPNRVYMPAHNVSLPPDDYGLYLAERARGGVGLIIAGAYPVSAGTARGPGVMPWDTSWADTVRRIVQPARDLGTPVIAQLFHMGASGVRRTDDIAHWGPLLAPSAIPSPVHRGIPKVLEDAEIRQLIDAFARSARTLQAGGADGVEIHGSHGYLLANFLSPYWNRRDDAWGGDTARRVRIVREIGHAIRALCGTGFALGVKLSLDEYLGEAGTTPDETVRVVALLEAERLFDYICLSHTDYHAIHRLAPPACSGENAPLAQGAARVRGQLRGRIPLLIQGSVADLAQAAQIVRGAQADMVGFARAHIADPALVHKARAGRVDETVRCVGANQGCWARLGLPVSCTVNPAAGRERQYGVAVQRPAIRARRILVVGGGPAGLKFADTAAALGHQVTLWEHDGVLGGQVRRAAALPGHESLLRLVDDLAASLARRGVVVELRKSATPERIQAHGADKVVLATGARWQTDGLSTFRVDRPGIGRSEGAHVIGPVAAVDDPHGCGRSVLIVDDLGNYVGLGLARLLAAHGRRVVLVTADALAGRKLETTLERPWLMPLAVADGIRVVTSHFVEHIGNGEAQLRDVYTGALQEVAADTTVLCMLRAAEDALYAVMLERGMACHRIGDCLAPREIDDAVLEGFRAAHAIGIPAMQAG